MKISKKFKKILNVVGGLLGIIGVIFVFFKFYTYWHQIHLFQISTSIWVTLFLLSVLSSFISILLALSWRNILLFLKIPIFIISSIEIYGISQISKYLPGNIFQYIGRQTLGMSAGIPGWKIVKSMIIEIFLIVCVATFISLIFISNLYNTFNGHKFFLIIFLCIVFFLVYKIAKKYICYAILCYFTYSIINSLIFAFVLYCVSTFYRIDLSTMFVLCSSYIIAWLIGFITPGAPAGLGIREAVLIFLLKGLISEADIVLCVVISRLISIVGDFIFYLIAIFLRFYNTNRKTYSTLNQIDIPRYL